MMVANKQTTLFDTTGSLIIDPTSVAVVDNTDSITGERCECDCDNCVECNCDPEVCQCKGHKKDTVIAGASTRGTTDPTLIFKNKGQDDKMLVRDFE